jgi:hypothetical protein
MNEMRIQIGCAFPLFMNESNGGAVGEVRRRIENFLSKAKKYFQEVNS